MRRRLHTRPAAPVVAPSVAGHPSMVPCYFPAPRMRTRRQTLGWAAGLPLLGASVATSAAAPPAPPPRAPARREMGRGLRLGKGAKLVMVGDSITDVGRKRPVGEGLAAESLGHGYVQMVDALLGAVYPGHAIRVVNQGTSGNTVRDLKKRWQTDVLDLKPDWVSIMIGTNDVWRQFDQPRQRELHVLPDEYERVYEELVEATKPAVKGLVLMTPFYLEPSRADAMRARMDEYGGIVRRIAGRHGLPLVDTQAAFDAALKHYYPATLGWDRVHPNHVGHMILARAFLGAVGFGWEG